MDHEYIKTKLNIHEAYDNGYITEDEKNTLLSLLDSDYISEAVINKEKQKILDEQDIIKKNFKGISSDLKNMVLSNAGSYKLKITEKKFFSGHEDHREQHYLLTYELKSIKDLSKSEISKILADIGNKVEKEFKKDKKDFISRGVYFDNKKKDEITRFVELHYDFY